MDTALLLIKTGHVLSLTDIYTIDHSCSNKCTKELGYPIGYHLITEEGGGGGGGGGGEKRERGRERGRERERERGREGERERERGREGGREGEVIRPEEIMNIIMSNLTSEL